MVSTDAGLIPEAPLARPDCQVIDAHGHIGVPAVDKLVVGRPEHGRVMQAMAESSGEASMRQNLDVVLPRAGQRFASLEARLKDLDNIGIDIQIVSPSPHLYCYWADQALAEEIVGLINGAVCDLVARAPDRLGGLGTVSLQHPELAAKQVQDAMSSGLKGVEISASVGELELSDPSLEPFWAAAAEAGAVIFIHPLGSSLGRRLNKHYLSNTVGQPIETTIALSHMIYEGIFDRYPALKVLGAHAGGYLPHYIGRSDQAWRARPEVAGCKDLPSTYLSKIHYDTVLFDDVYIRHLTARVGVERVLFGTDYPFDMADYDPERLASALNAEDQDAVLGGNAKRLFGLP